MPGTVIFKPIEANITHSTEFIGKMDPYCLFHVGTQKIKGQVCRKGGKHPQWEDSIVVPITNQASCTIDVKDKDLFHDDKIGTFEVDLREIETQGRIKKWYPLFYKEKPAGEILLEAIYAGDSTASVNQGLTPYGDSAMMGDVIPSTTTTAIQQPIVPSTTVTKSIIVNQTVAPTQVVKQEVILGAAIPTGSIYGSQSMGSQGMNYVQGDNVMPVMGGNYPSTYSNYINPSLPTGDFYAQEALFRGAGPQSYSYATRSNQNSNFGGLSQFGGVNPSVSGLNQNIMPINATSQQIPFGNIRNI